MTSGHRLERYRPAVAPNRPRVRRGSAQPTAWFLLDLSPSVDFGSVADDRHKRTVLVDVVATLARVLTRHGNRVGAIFYGREVERVIPARAGRDQVLRLIRDLSEHPRHARAPMTDLTELLRSGRRWMRRRSLVFVISDFISEPGWERELELMSRRHEVLAIRLADPRESTLPDVGPLLVEDAETGEQLVVDTSDRAFRRPIRRCRSGTRGRHRQGVRARRRRCHPALDRRGPRARHRAHGGPSAPPGEAAGVTFIWPAALLLLILIPIGIAIDRAIARRRQQRLAARAWAPCQIRRTRRPGAPGGEVAHGEVARGPTGERRGSLRRRLPGA